MKQEERRKRAEKPPIGRPAVVDLTDFPEATRKALRTHASMLARREVLEEHKDQYNEAYKGWLEILAEQKRKEG